MKYKEAKELFRDVIDIDRYIPLISSQKIEIDIKNAILQKDKMVLLSGEAGSGKSFILNKVYEDLKESHRIILIKNPFIDFRDIEDLFANSANFVGHKTVLIDEAQILPQDDIERLRLLTDTGDFTVVLATHILNAKEIFSKKHFQTRISYNLQVLPIQLDEVESFIVAKLFKKETGNISTLLHKSNYKYIYKITNGNLREINKLMYKTFDILDYFNENYPYKINSHKLQNKFIEMANMDLKGFNA